MIKLTEHTDKSHTWFCIGLMTPYEDDIESGTNTLHIALGKHGWFFDVPGFLKPKEHLVTYVIDGVTKEYTKHIQRNYGFSFTEDAIHVQYGAQPGDWIKDDPENSDHTKLFNYFWNFEHVRHEAYYTDGTRACYGDYFREWSYQKNDNPYNADTREQDFQTVSWFTLPLVDEPRKRQFGGEEEPNFSDVSVGTPVFQFFKYTDFDGMETVARVNIEEREWIRGKWPWMRSVLKYVPGCRMIRRCIEIEFRDPVGERKSSWKGGTVGMSYPMAKDHTISQAWFNFVVSGDRP